MDESVNTASTDMATPTRGLLWLVVATLFLGGVYNYIGLRSQPGWGIPWIATDRLAQLRDTPVVDADPTAPAAAAPVMSDDPLAIPAQPAASLPPIPDVGRPVEIALGALAQYVDASAALVIDAREDWEYAEGHIPGAINLPYDEAVTDPVRLEALDNRGLPIVTYCGGGSCEQSLSLAWELYGFGHTPVAVYMGGFPEWVESGRPVERGGGS
jgi:rhodanese-related sulfurtransferase